MENKLVCQICLEAAQTISPDGCWCIRCYKEFMNEGTFQSVFSKFGKILKEK